MKFTDVATFIASGNVIFSSKEGDAPKLTKKIEAHLQAKLGYAVDTFLRTRAELAAVAAFRPFAETAAEKTTPTLHVGFLKEPLTAAQARGLEACATAVDELRVAGREYYWLCRIKSHESTVWASRTLRALALPSSSMRNVTTVRKLAALYPAP
jgi:uncharacterized protein (DUF1697 family)